MSTVKLLTFLLVVTGVISLGLIMQQDTKETASRDRFSRIARVPLEQATDASFSGFVNDKSGSVLVTFFVEGFCDCRAQESILQNMSRSSVATKFVKVNIEECPGLAKRFSIESSPTLAVFQNSELIGKHEGIAAPETITSLIAKNK